MAINNVFQFQRYQNELSCLHMLTARNRPFIEVLGRNVSKKWALLSIVRIIIIVWLLIYGPVRSCPIVLYIIMWNIWTCMHVMMQAVRDATNEININFPQRISSEKRRENSLQRLFFNVLCVGQTTRHEWTERTMKTSTNRLRMFNTWREVRKAQHLQLEDVKYPSVLCKWVSSSAQRNIVRQPDRRIVEKHFRDFSSVFDVVRDAPSSLVLFGCFTEILTLGGGLFTKKYIHFRKILKKIQKSQTAWREKGDSIKIIKNSQS